jgi:hypothetical protein
MTRILPDLLSDTLNLVQLARETALARGDEPKAARLEPIADHLHTLARTARQSPPAKTGAPASDAPPPAAGILGQNDFQALLRAVRAAGEPGPAASSDADRRGIVQAMAAAGMAEMDIARHMGITRDEVRLAVRTARVGRLE